MTSAELKRLWHIQSQGLACAVNLAKYLMTREKRRKPSLRKAEKEAKKLGKKGRWEAVKAAVRARAQGLCECGCGGWAIVMDPDHFYGKRQETVQTVWQLNRSCHDDKTHNYPVRRYWDDKFKAHCEKYGYPFRPRLTKQLTGSKA